LSPEEEDGKGGLSKKMIQKFLCHARHYILAYFFIEHNQDSYIDGELSELNIERVKKECKTYHSTIDFDEKFINYCF
jgi:hypothetical protein